jgi:outer membrane protein OmpA-like peptidoglycan-associated protein
MAFMKIVSILALITILPTPASLFGDMVVPSDFWSLSRGEILRRGYLSLKLDAWGVNEDLFAQYEAELFGAARLRTSYGFFGRIEAGFIGRVQIDIARTGDVLQREIAPGDFGGFLRLGIVNDPYSPVGLAAEIFGSTPTGSEAAGLMRSGHFTSGNLDLGGRLLLTLRAPLYHIHLNAGAVNYQRSESSGPYDEPFFLYGAGLELFPDNVLSPWGEFGGLTAAGDPADYRDYPVWAAAGLILKPFSGLNFSAGLRYNLSRLNSSCLFDWERDRFRGRAGVTVDWHLFHRRLPDTDKDGVPDRWDLTPYMPEDVDNFLDHDGTPDWDNDGDGIADHLDKDPLRPEDTDGFQDDDGAPDRDNDGDGIADVVDKCPDLPETFNGYLDDDGCPDTPPAPGITAPARKETVPPESDITPFPRRTIIEGLAFASGRSDILPRSYPVLDRLIVSMSAHPGTRFELRGYTDSRGSAQVNLRLSRARAESVRKYMLSKGVPPTLISARGLGEVDPIASNESARGRTRNRRVELIRID